MALQVSRFNLPELYTSFFGKAYRFLPVPSLGGRSRFTVAEGELEPHEDLFTELQGSTLQAFDKPLKVYQSTEGLAIFMPTSIDGYQLPNEPTVEISGGKSIVKTEVAGRDGDVKENMGLRDWKITIRGIAISQTEDYPFEVVKKLRDLCLKKTALNVDNWLCATFNIKRLVIEDWDFPDMQGHQNCQAYRFDCLSDAPITLNLRKLKRR